MAEANGDQQEQASAAAKGTPPGGAAAGAAGDLESRHAESEKQLKLVREEAANRRRENNELKTNLTERERTAKELQDERDSLKSKVREYESRDAISSALTGYNPVEPEAVMRLVLAQGVPIDEKTGKPTEEGLKTAIEAVVKQYPGLFGRNRLAGDAGAGGAGGEMDMNRALRQATGRG